MSDSARSSRPSKRPLDAVVIDAENSTNGQPAAKKAADPVLPQEVLDIHQRVDKLYKDKQGAIRIAAEAQARVEYLEKLVDQKPAPVDDTNKKLAEELRKRIEEMTRFAKHRDELTNKLVEADGREKKLADDMNRKIEELTNNRNELARKLAEAGDREKKMMEEQLNRMDELAQANDAQKKLAEEQQKKIDELSLKLKQYEGAQQQQLQPDKAPSKKVVTTGSVPSTSGRSLASASNHSSNIFKLYPTSFSKSVEFTLAQKMLLKIDQKARKLFGNTQWEERLDIFLKDDKIGCALCKKSFKCKAIISHFLISEGHRSKVLRADEGFISRAALDYWINKLESLTKKKATAAVVTVAPAAPAE